MTVVLALTGVMIAIGAILALVRVAVGPTMLNRMLALEVIVVTVISSLGLLAAMSGNTTLLVVMAALTLLGFVGSVSVSRFSAKEN